MKRERRFRLARRAVLCVAVLVTISCIALLLAAIRNDRAITGQLGVANAQVDSVSFDRTIIRYETPDGIVHSPSTGVLYPAGLQAGDLVRIEYDIGNPELARVAGRSATFTLAPLGITIAVTWAIAILLFWFLGRRGGIRIDFKNRPAWLKRRKLASQDSQ